RSVIVSAQLDITSRSTRGAMPHLAAACCWPILGGGAGSCVGFDDDEAARRAGGRFMMPAEGVRWAWLAGDALRAARHAQAGSPQIWTVAAVVVAIGGFAIVALQALGTQLPSTLGP